MSTSMFDAQEISRCKLRIRAGSAELPKNLRRSLRLATRPIVQQMKATMPHQANASAAKGSIRYSDSLSSLGGAIVIGKKGPPGSWASAFAGNQVGRGGTYKHPVFGNWSTSPNTIMKASTYVADAWEKGRVQAQLAAGVAIEATLNAITLE